MNEIMMKNRNKLYKYGQSFVRTFRVPLNKFLDPFTGFDIVAFDEWLKVPDGISTKEYVTKKYGENVCRMIEGLI